MSSEQKDSRIEMLGRLAELRLSDCQRCAEEIALAARRCTRRATVIRVMIICLGALVAGKGVLDNILRNLGAKESGKMALEICFMIIGLSISVAAGLEAAFKFEKRGSGLMALIGRCHNLEREYMSLYAAAQYEQDTDRGADRLQYLIQKHNEELAQVYGTAASFGLNLVTQNSVDYSKLDAARLS
jgi:hypothetical protein